MGMVVEEEGVMLPVEIESEASLLPSQAINKDMISFGHHSCARKTLVIVVAVVVGTALIALSHNLRLANLERPANTDGEVRLSSGPPCTIAGHEFSCCKNATGCMAYIDSCSWGENGNYDDSCEDPESPNCCLKCSLSDFAPAEISGPQLCG